MEKIGINVQKKVFLKLISEYKEVIRENKMIDEKYKWELVDKYKGRPNTDVDDWSKEIIEIDYSNLIYPFAIGVLKEISKAFPNETKNMFISLFNEKQALKERISNFSLESTKLFKRIKEDMKGFQDERAVATYLTFQNPNKYTFYKNSFYQKICDLLGVKTVGAGEKYVHYLELVNLFIDEYISKDIELIELVKSYIPDYYNGENHLILAQDILYSVLDKEIAPNYWIFQGNPNVYNIVEAINDKALKNWSIKAHKNAIKKGDKFILWITGNEAGCYALGEVISEVYRSKETDEELKYYSEEVEDKESDRVDIKITHNLTNRPIYKHELEILPEFDIFNGGNQGTNFSATKEQYLKLEDIANEDNQNVDFMKKLSKFNDNDVKAYIEFLREIIEHFDLKYGDPRLVFSVYGGRLNLTVGHRYSWNLYRNNKEGSFGVISAEAIDENSSSFRGKAPLPFYNYINTAEFTEIEKESIFKAIENELKRVSKSAFRSKSQDDFERYVFKKNDINKKKYILSNITWNSNDWKKPSNDKSNHKWVQIEGNIPHESWNFDFDNSRNTEDKIYGYNQWTKPPTVTGSNNLIIFYSDGKIVGFYGKVEILKESVPVSENEDYNLIAEKDLSLVLENKIEDIKTKGYLENKQKMGMIGFTYLKSEDNIIRILNEAKLLNPNQSKKINAIIAWINNEDTILLETEEKEKNLNKILYGPPGTGKTYSLQKDYFEKFIIRQNTKTKEVFIAELVQGLSWWEVAAIELYDIDSIKVPDLMNTELIKVKSKYSNNSKPGNTVWYYLQQHTALSSTTVNMKDRKEPFIFSKAENSKWSINKSDFEESCPDLVEKYHQIKDFKPITESKENFKFVTFHQSFTYEDFIEGIKPVISDSTEGSEVTYEIADGVFKKLAIEAKQNPNANYAIFIDEINRGNISQIFGELITLIEDDKRLGEENELKVVLPYSKTEFGVPSNLYIIGTMNTADRSVEALDTALRRRFSFIEVTPKPELIKEVGVLKDKDGYLEGVNIVDLLVVINKRIEKLVDRDHMIGHSYFLKVLTLKDLKVVFQNKVIPLLQEYFFGDYGKIGLVIGKAFFEDINQDDDDNFFADFDYDASSLLEKVSYHIKNVIEMSDDDFIIALNALLGKENIENE